MQLLSTQPNKDDYYKIIVNNKIGYIRHIYHVTISFNLIKNLWFEGGGIVSLDTNSVFFKIIIEMQYKEIFDEELNINQLQQENKQLKNEIFLLKNLKSKNSNHG